MRILVIADPHVAVPPSLYGGTERMAGFFCDAMRRRGHNVNLLAAVGSERYGGRYLTHLAPSRFWLSRAFRKLWFQILCLWAVRGADVVMNYGRVDYLWTLLRTRVPIVFRFANPVEQPEIDWILSQRSKSVRFLGISHFQMGNLEPSDLIQVIYNPTATERFVFQKEPADPPYIVFLGRITENKGAHTAIAVARRVGIHLKLAGNISNELGGKQYFETRIRPTLGDSVEYVGPVDDEAKQHLLGGARALIFPIRWPEPFGIVMIESLACGTPVIATRCASTPEIVRHGQTGFLCESVDELVDAVARSTQLSRRACRLDAEQRFSIDVITNQHEAFLKEMIGAS